MTARLVGFLRQKGELQVGDSGNYVYGMHAPVAGLTIAPLGGLGAGAVPIAGGHVEGAVGVLAAAVLLRPTRVTLAVEALELGKPRGVFLPARQHSRDHGRQRMVRGMQAWGSW